MKKQYVKPTMLVEDFVLNDYIAVCTKAASFTSGPNGCTAPSSDMEGLWGTGAIYVSDFKTCAGNIELPEFAGQFCYHTPAGTYRLFVS